MSEPGLPHSASQAEGAPRSPLLFPALALAALTLFVFWPSLGHGFVNYDDDGYVYENARVVQGLGGGGWKWALTATEEFNWHPLTWLSLMLDSEIHGLRGDVAPFHRSAEGFHLTNVLLHVGNAVLLLCILARLTGAVWRSALVAAFFGIHPLHVESVAWIAERKDVLSTLFWLLSTWTYACYARQPRSHAYVSTLLLLALGLTAKPMLVTLPLVFLLMDFWPLGRSSVGVQRLLQEKVPMFAIVAASSVATLLVQHQGGSVRSFESVGLGVRAANAAVAAVAYLGKTAWPADLAAFYPHPGSRISAGLVAGSVLALASITYAALRFRQSRPWFAFGWFWYLVTLLPVIGLIQVGAQAMADRYTYIPSIGIFVAASWGAWDLARAAVGSGRGTWLPLSAVSAAVLCACAWRARVQVGTWKDSETLFRHALACTSGNYIAHNNLGVALAGQGRIEEAVSHYESAMAIEPRFSDARVNLGKALLEQQKIPEAIACLETAVRSDPDDAEAQNNLGVALAMGGRPKEAIEHFQRAIELDPGKEGWRQNLERARSLAEEKGVPGAQPRRP